MCCFVVVNGEFFICKFVPKSTVALRLALSRFSSAWMLGSTAFKQLPNQVYISKMAHWRSHVIKSRRFNGWNCILGKNSAFTRRACMPRRTPRFPSYCRLARNVVFGFWADSICKNARMVVRELSTVLFRELEILVWACTNYLCIVTTDNRVFLNWVSTINSKMTVEQWDARCAQIVPFESLNCRVADFRFA